MSIDAYLATRGARETDCCPRRHQHVVRRGRRDTIAPATRWARSGSFEVNGRGAGIRGWMPGAGAGMMVALAASHLALGLAWYR